MRIKQKPEDFSVKESYRFDEVASGSHRVYLMDKQKLSTFDAVNRLRQKYGLKPGAISYCGLKDKQGRTEQLIAVDGADVDMQEPDLRLKYLGRTDRGLSARNITSNRFSVTVRAVKEEELPQVNLAAAEVNRLGVVNYFDSQRFGSLKHGQGFIAKDLLRGDFEKGLHNYMAVPSPLDRSEDSRVKQFWADNWGDWGARCPFEGNRKYHRVISALRESPQDFVKAFLAIDSDYRAMQLFTFQSYLWNEGVRRMLQLMLPREQLFVMPYQAGTLLFHRDADPAVLDQLRSLTFPLLSPESTFKNDTVKEAAMWALGKEKLTLAQLRVEKAPKLLYFRHEERPVLVYPHKLVLGKTQRDELNKPHLKLNVAFTLPPGSYATLVVKRLFHFGYRDDTDEEIKATQTGVAEAVAQRTAREIEYAKLQQQQGLLPTHRPAPERPQQWHAAADAARPAHQGGPYKVSGTSTAPARRGSTSTNPVYKVSGTSGRPAQEGRPAGGRPTHVPSPLDGAQGYRARAKAKKDARAKAQKAQAKPAPKAPKSRRK